MAVAHGAPAALAEPVVPVRRSWIGLLFAANLGLWMALFTPIQILLPVQISAIGVSSKETALGWVTGLGALVAIIANPVAGAFSDRTRLRIRGRAYGRRHAWTLGGAAISVLSLLALAHVHTIAGVAIGWAGAQFGLNVMLATLTAAVPDRVPVDQRGLVSGWIGMPQALGLVLGAVLATAVFTGNSAGYVAMAVALAVLAVPFALLTPDDPLPPSVRIDKTDWRIDVKSHPDFAWAWATRFLVQLGNALGTLYLLYFLTDRVKLADPETGLLIMILLYTLGMVATAVFGGRRSDASGRRKVFVIWSGVLMAIAALVLAVWPTCAAGRRLRGVHRRRHRADHPGPAGGHPSGQGPGRHQHRIGGAAGARSRAGRPDGHPPGRLPDPVWGHRRGNAPGIGDGRPDPLGPIDPSRPGRLVG